MSYVSVNDVLEELAEENTRLTNELLVAKQCLTVLCRFKSFVEILFNEVKHNFNANDSQKYNDLFLEVEEVVNRRLWTETDDNNDKDNNVGFSSDNELMAKKSLKIFKDNKSSKTDRKRNDMSSNQIVFGCDVCHKEFNLRSGLKRHLRYEHNINDKTDGKDENRDQSGDHPTANGQSHRTKTIDKPFECSVCKLKFSFVSNAKRHLRNMHKITDNLNDFIINGQKTNSDDPSVGQSEDSKSLECHVCHKVFNCKSNVNRHLREYHKLTKVVLNREVSGSASESDSEAEDRYVRRDSRSFECHICQKEFFCMSNVNKHLRLIHGVVTNNMRRKTEEEWTPVQGSDGSFICDVTDCGKQFRSAQKLRYHKITIHCIRRRFACDWPGCHYSVGWECMLNKHKMVHSSDYSFVCSRAECGKRFKANKYLKQHMQVHNPLRVVSAERRFRCAHDGCDKVFTSKGNLRTHTVIAHLGVRLACDWPGCEYKAGTKYHLKSHCIQTHGSERPFACNWQSCDKRFKMKDKLKQHMKYHLNDKRHACHWPGCQYRCVTAENLKIHLKTHLKEYNFLCEWPECGKRFKTNNCLDSHRKSHSK